MRARWAATLPLLLLALDCRTPTQITVEIRTNFPCTDAKGTTIHVGGLGSLETRDAVTDTTQCVNGRVGSIVVVPSGGRSEQVGIRVVTGVTNPATTCTAANAYAGCIVARRALTFIPHEELLLPIEMEIDCKDVPCSATETCRNGVCVSAVITDSTPCARAEGCGADVLAAGKPPTTPTGKPLWARSFGDLGEQVALDLAVDGAGNPVVLVESLISSTESDSLDFGNGELSGTGRALYAAKLDRDGKALWSKRWPYREPATGGAGDPLFGTSYREAYKRVASDAAGNTFLAIETGSIDLGKGPIAAKDDLGDVLIAKLDTVGNEVFTVGGTGTGFSLPAVAIDPSGNLLVTGAFEGTSTFAGQSLTSAAEADGFVAKLDPKGGLLWVKRFGGFAIDEGIAIGSDAAGNVYVAGACAGPIDFGGPPTASPTDYPGVFLAKLDPSGKQLWAQAFGGKAAAARMAVTPKGEVFLSANVVGSIDFDGKGDLPGDGLSAFARFDTDGKPLWSMRSAVGDGWGSAAAIDGDGNVVVVGDSGKRFDVFGAQYDSRGANDLFVVKLSPASVPLWRIVAGDAGNQTASSVAINQLGEIFVAGSLYGTVDLGNGVTVTSSGARPDSNQDVFVAKLAP